MEIWCGTLWQYGGQTTNLVYPNYSWVELGWGCGWAVTMTNICIKFISIWLTRCLKVCSCIDTALILDVQVIFCLCVYIGFVLLFRFIFHYVWENMWTEEIIEIMLEEQLITWIDCGDYETKIRISIIKMQKT